MIRSETLPPPIDGGPMLKPVMPAIGKPEEAREEASSPATTPTKARPPAAKLDFVDGGGLDYLIKLRRPFRWEGEEVRVLKVRRLTIDEVGDLVGAGVVPDVFDAYAVMVGLPAEVLRGLDADDGEEVAKIAAGFLPRLLQAAYGFTSASPIGEPSPAA